MPSQNTKIVPLTALAYYEQAMEHLHTEQITDALNDIDMAISLSTDKSLYVFYKIHILYLSGLTTECISLILSHFHFLYTHCTLDQFNKLLTYYQELCDCTTDELANTLTLHNVPYILASLYPILETSTDYNFHSKALEYKQSNDLKGCISCCNLALKFEPLSLSLLHLQATCYIDLKEYSHAIILYEQLLTLQVLTSEISYPLALAYMQVGNLKQAISYFKQLLSEIPRHIDGLLHLGECYMQSNQQEQAIPYFEKLMRIEPDNTSYILKLGEIHNLLGHKRLATKYYKLAQELPPEKPPIHTLSHKKIRTIGLGVIILILSILQFYLFNLGILPSAIYDVKVNVDSFVIPVNGFTDFKISYKQFPPYSKEPTLQVISSHPQTADVIEGLSSLNGFMVGEAIFNVHLNDISKANFTIQVKEAVPVDIKLQLSDSPLTVGMTSNMNWTVIYEHDISGDLMATFTSSDSSILSISSSGDLVKAIAPGKATIIATCENISTSLKVEVTTP